MKPNKKKAKEYLMKEFFKRINEKEKEIMELHNKMFDMVSGKYDKKLEIEESSDKKSWYINIPCVVWTFVEK